MAYALAERGAHVFAVDLDPQMNLTTSYVVKGTGSAEKGSVDRNGDRRLSANYPYAAQTAVRLYHHRHELGDQSADDQCSYRCGR
ncbi:ParA family protein [Flavonifractor plautii]|uniref:ParA family protein n=1 Tax=Flavonifractor plautii TaxID=292800 RepID=UPI00352FFAB1